MPSDPQRVLRALRHIGLSLLLTAGPTCALVWSESGARMGIIVLLAQLYVGVFGAFALPWILKALMRRQGSDVSVHD